MKQITLDKYIKDYKPTTVTLATEIGQIKADLEEVKFYMKAMFGVSLQLYVKQMSKKEIDKFTGLNTKWFVIPSKTNEPKAKNNIKRKE